MTKEELNSLPGQFCVGRKKKIDLANTEIYSQQSEKKFDRIPAITDDILTVLYEDDPQNIESIDGGACLGDSGEYQFISCSNFPNDNILKEYYYSGGPFFKMVGKYPVVEGVCSYLLWGTCRGRMEPTYYDKVKYSSSMPG